MDKISIKKTMLALFISFALAFSSVSAEPYNIFGGIKRDMTLKKNVYYYEEMFFLTGKAILLKGTVTIPEIPKTKNYNLNVKYNVFNKNEKITLDRQVNYQIESEYKKSGEQVISNWTIKEGGLKESFEIGDKKYELTGFQFDNSELKDKKAAIEFKSGNIFYKKVFHSDGDLSDEGSKIEIIANSESNLGFENFWSSTNSLIIDKEIKFSNLGTSKNPSKIGPLDKLNEKEDSWEAKVKYKVSSKKTKSLEFIENNVKNISFRRGILQSTNTEDTLSYEYDLPVLDKKETSTEADDKDKTIDKEKEHKSANPFERNKNSASLAAFLFKKSTRLPVPKFKDLESHWAEDDIFKLASLEAFPHTMAFFPDDLITRAQFARAVVNSIDSIAEESEALRKEEFIKSKRKGAKKIIYEDIRRDDINYIFIEEALKKNIMIGEGDGQFLPTRPLTRAEAITVLIRTLGVDDIAPAMDFKTGFKDDAKIPSWSKPAIYMSKYIGFVDGYKDNTIRALRHMTRAEAASMLSRFIEHLRKEISIDYREKLIDEF